tara:strand:- start:686 stop:1096 length:411 start_codon:yes stop_codon:yes gene_type:complete
VAYVSKENKQVIAQRVKELFDRTGFKGTVAGQGSPTLRVTIKAGPYALPVGPGYEPAGPGGKSYYRVNPYRFRESEKLSEDWKSFLVQLEEAIKGDIWFDKSDSMFDYFHTAFYINIDIGNRKNGYTRVEPLVEAS